MEASSQLDFIIQDECTVSSNYSKKVIRTYLTNIQKNGHNLVKLGIYDLKSKTKTVINLSEPIVFSKRLKDLSPEEITEAVSSGYNLRKFSVAKVIYSYTVTSDGETFAYADSTGIYLLSLKKADEKVKPVLLKPFNVLENPPNGKHPILVNNLAFNNLGTKLGVEYMNGEVEIISLKNEPKTLEAYFKRIGVCKEIQKNPSIDSLD